MFTNEVRLPAMPASAVRETWGSVRSRQHQSAAGGDHKK